MAVEYFILDLKILFQSGKKMLVVFFIYFAKKKKAINNSRRNLFVCFRNRFACVLHRRGLCCPCMYIPVHTPLPPLGGGNAQKCCEPKRTRRSGAGRIRTSESWLPTIIELCKSPDTIGIKLLCVVF